jgi:hypothetical protein
VHESLPQTAAGKSTISDEEFKKVKKEVFCQLFNGIEFLYAAFVMLLIKYWIYL